MGLTLPPRPPLSSHLRIQIPPTSAEQPVNANGGIVAFRGRSSTEKAACTSLINVLGSRKKGLQPGLPSPSQKHLEPCWSRCERACSAAFSEQHSEEKRPIIFRGAQNVAKFDRESLKNHKARRVDSKSLHRIPQNDLQLERGGREWKKKTSSQASVQASSSRFDEFSSRAHGARRRHGANESSRGDEKTFSRKSPNNNAGWLPYAAATVTLASAAAAVRGILSGSAHAFVGDGGNRPRPPPGSSGGGGGGDGGGGFNSEFGGKLVGAAPYEKRKVDEDLLNSVSSVQRRESERPLSAVEEGTSSNGRVRSLASLSSAAGDLLDGEAPIGGAMSRRYGPAEEIGDHLPKHMKPTTPNLGPYMGGTMPYDDSRRGSRESMVRKYDPTDPFFSEDGRPSQDRPSIAGPESRAEDGRGRDASPAGRYSPFDAMHSPSGKPNPNKHVTPTELNMAANNYYGHTTSRGPQYEAPQELSSMRRKATEIPGYIQEEEGGQFEDQQQESVAADFSGWVGGLVHSIVGNVGKRTGGGRSSGAGVQNADDLEKQALVSEVATRTLQIITDQASESGIAKSSETGALRRLQREAFSDLLKVRERLHKLEQHSGFHCSNNFGDALAGARTTLKGEVNSGGAFVLMEDLTSNLSRFSLQHAGMLTGLDVRFTFETPVRENDMLTTQCGVGQVSGETDGSILGGPISLQKINYVAQINDTLSVSVAPLGARASDMSDTVNHLQGQALTTFAGSGPALYQYCRGSAIGMSLRSNSALLSMSQFLSGWGDRAADATGGPLCLSTLAQFMVQPLEHLVFSLSAVNNLWPSPPLPSSSGFHWSEMGPMVLCKTITRPTQPTGTFTYKDLPTSSSASFLSQGRLPERDSWSPDVESRIIGTAMQSVALSGEMDLGGHVSVGGWAQVERADWLQELERKDFQWNLSLAKSSGPNVNWGLSVGRRKREDWGEDGSASPTSGPIEPSSSQLQMEAFIKWKVGRGFTLQPGLVYIVDKYTQTPAVMVRSSWSL